MFYAAVWGHRAEMNTRVSLVDSELGTVMSRFYYFGKEESKDILEVPGTSEFSQIFEEGAWSGS